MQTSYDLIRHAKFQDHMKFVSREDDFSSFCFKYMGVASILVMRPRQFIQMFVPLSQGGSIYDLALIGLAVFREEDV